MKIKKNDNVIVVAGKDKGKTGKVVKAMPKDNQVLVEGVNIVKKHQRARKSGSKGQTVEKTMPIDVSNVMLIEDKKGVRTKSKIVGGKKIRVSVKSGKEL